MSTKFKILSLTFLYATSIVLGLSSKSFASCTSEISDSQTHYSIEAENTLFAGGFVSMASTLHVPTGVVSAGGLAVSSTIDKMTALSDNERYAYSILNLYDRADKASFIKLVQRTVAKDKHAVIPTEDEIISSVQYVDTSLIACRNSSNKFFKPTKESLLKVVLEDLNLQSR